MVQCVGTMRWYNALLQCVGAMRWYNALVQCVGAMCWCNALVQRVFIGKMSPMSKCIAPRIVPRHFGDIVICASALLLPTLRPGVVLPTGTHKLPAREQTHPPRFRVCPSRAHRRVCVPSRPRPRRSRWPSWSSCSRPSTARSASTAFRRDAAIEHRGKSERRRGCTVHTAQEAHRHGAQSYACREYSYDNDLSHPRAFTTKRFGQR